MPHFLPHRMGAGGTAVALETADVVLMGDDLGKRSFAIGLSRASARSTIVVVLNALRLLAAHEPAPVHPYRKIQPMLIKLPTDKRVSELAPLDRLPR